MGNSWQLMAKHSESMMQTLTLVDCQSPLMMNDSLMTNEKYNGLLGLFMCFLLISKWYWLVGGLLMFY